MQETQVRLLGREDLLEEEMVIPSSGESRGQRSLGGYSHRSRTQLNMHDTISPHGETWL